jgi:hypothetical protein
VNESAQHGIKKKRDRQQEDDVDQVTPPRQSASSFVAFGIYQN